MVLCSLRVSSYPIPIPILKTTPDRLVVLEGAGRRYFATDPGEKQVPCAVWCISFAITGDGRMWHGAVIEKMIED